MPGAALLAFWLAAAAPAPKPLAIVNLELHQYEDGPPLAPSYVFQTGDTVFLSFQVSGFRVSPDDKITLSYRLEAFDSEGLPLAPATPGKVSAELAVEDKNWMPKVRYNVLVPPLASSGQYRIAIRVKDELGGAEAAGEVRFQAQGRRVEPSATLVVRNLRFLRAEEDETPLAPAAYRPGDALWARFEITGYKLAEGNRFEVEYGVTVLRASGEILYSEPKAASERKQSFYPQRYVPGGLSLKLDADIARGEYTLVVSARDLVGNQQCETRQTFRVE